MQRRISLTDHQASQDDKTENKNSTPRSSHGSAVFRGASLCGKEVSSSLRSPLSTSSILSPSSSASFSLRGPGGKNGTVVVGGPPPHRRTLSPHTVSHRSSSTGGRVTEEILIEIEEEENVDNHYEENNSDNKDNNRARGLTVNRNRLQHSGNTGDGGGDGRSSRPLFNLTSRRSSSVPSICIKIFPSAASPSPSPDWTFSSPTLESVRTNLDGGTPGSSISVPHFHEQDNGVPSSAPLRWNRTFHTASTSTPSDHHTHNGGDGGEMYSTHIPHDSCADIPSLQGTSFSMREAVGGEDRYTSYSSARASGSSVRSSLPSRTSSSARGGAVALDPLVPPLSASLLENKTGGKGSSLWGKDSKSRMKMRGSSPNSARSMSGREGALPHYGRPSSNHSGDGRTLSGSPPLLTSSRRSPRTSSSNNNINSDTEWIDHGVSRRKSVLNSAKGLGIRPEEALPPPTAQTPVCSSRSSTSRVAAGAGGKGGLPQSTTIPPSPPLRHLSRSGDDVTPPSSHHGPSPPLSTPFRTDVQIPKGGRGNCRGSPPGDDSGGSFSTPSRTSITTHTANTPNNHNAHRSFLSPPRDRRSFSVSPLARLPFHSLPQETEEVPPLPLPPPPPHRLSHHQQETQATPPTPLGTIHPPSVGAALSASKHEYDNENGGGVGPQGHPHALLSPLSTFPPPLSTFPPPLSTFPPPLSTFPPPLSTFPPPLSTFPPPLSTFPPPPPQNGSPQEGTEESSAAALLSFFHSNALPKEEGKKEKGGSVVSTCRSSGGEDGAGEHKETETLNIASGTEIPSISPPSNATDEDNSGCGTRFLFSSPFLNNRSNPRRFSGAPASTFSSNERTAPSDLQRKFGVEEDREGEGKEEEKKFPSGKGFPPSSPFDQDIQKFFRDPTGIDHSIPIRRAGGAGGGARGGEGMVLMRMTGTKEAEGEAALSPPSRPAEDEEEEEEKDEVALTITTTTTTIPIAPSSASASSAGREGGVRFRPEWRGRRGLIGRDLMPAQQKDDEEGGGRGGTSTVASTTPRSLLLVSSRQKEEQPKSSSSSSSPLSMGEGGFPNTMTEKKTKMAPTALPSSALGRGGEGRRGRGGNATERNISRLIRGRVRPWNRRGRGTGRKVRGRRTTSTALGSDAESSTEGGEEDSDSNFNSSDSTYSEERTSTAGSTVSTFSTHDDGSTTVSGSISSSSTAIPSLSTSTRSYSLSLLSSIDGKNKANPNKKKAHWWMLTAIEQFEPQGSPKALESSFLPIGNTPNSPHLDLTDRSGGALEVEVEEKEEEDEEEEEEEEEEEDDVEEEEAEEEDDDEEEEEETHNIPTGRGHLSSISGTGAIDWCIADPPSLTSHLPQLNKMPFKKEEKEENVEEKTMKKTGRNTSSPFSPISFRSKTQLSTTSNPSFANSSRSFSSPFSPPPPPPIRALKPEEKEMDESNISGKNPKKRFRRDVPHEGTTRGKNASFIQEVDTKPQKERRKKQNKKKNIQGVEEDEEEEEWSTSSSTPTSTLLSLRSSAPFYPAIFSSPLVETRPHPAPRESSGGGDPRGREGEGGGGATAGGASSSASTTPSGVSPSSHQRAKYRYSSTSEIFPSYFSLSASSSPQDTRGERGGPNTRSESTQSAAGSLSGAATSASAPRGSYDGGGSQGDGGGAFSSPSSSLSPTPSPNMTTATTTATEGSAHPHHPSGKRRRHMPKNKRTKPTTGKCAHSGSPNTCDDEEEDHPHLRNNTNNKTKDKSGNTTAMATAPEDREGSFCFSSKSGFPTSRWGSSVRAGGREEGGHPDGNNVSKGNSRVRASPDRDSTSSPYSANSHLYPPQIGAEGGRGVWNGHPSAMDDEGKADKGALPGAPFGMSNVHSRYSSESKQKDFPHQSRAIPHPPEAIGDVEYTKDKQRREEEREALRVASIIAKRKADCPDAARGRVSPEPFPWSASPSPPPPLISCSHPPLKAPLPRESRGDAAYDKRRRDRREEEEREAADACVAKRKNDLPLAARGDPEKDKKREEEKESRRRERWLTKKGYHKRCKRKPSLPEASRGDAEKSRERRAAREQRELEWQKAITKRRLVELPDAARGDPSKEKKRLGSAAGGEHGEEEEGAEGGGRGEHCGHRSQVCQQFPPLPQEARGKSLPYYLYYNPPDWKNSNDHEFFWRDAAMRSMLPKWAAFAVQEEMATSNRRIRLGGKYKDSLWDNRPEKKWRRELFATLDTPPRRYTNAIASALRIEVKEEEKAALKEMQEKDLQELEYRWGGERWSNIRKSCLYSTSSSSSQPPLPIAKYFSFLERQESRRSTTSSSNSSHSSGNEKKEKEDQKEEQKKDKTNHHGEDGENDKGEDEERKSNFPPFLEASPFFFFNFLRSMHEGAKPAPVLPPSPPQEPSSSSSPPQADPRTPRRIPPSLPHHRHRRRGRHHSPSPSSSAGGGGHGSIFNMWTGDILSSPQAWRARPSLPFLHRSSQTFEKNVYIAPAWNRYRRAEYAEAFRQYGITPGKMRKRGEEGNLLLLDDAEEEPLSPYRRGVTQVKSRKDKEGGEREENFLQASPGQDHPNNSANSSSGGGTSNDPPPRHTLEEKEKREGKTQSRPRDEFPYNRVETGGGAGFTGWGKHTVTPFIDKASRGYLTFLHPFEKPKEAKNKEEKEKKEEKEEKKSHAEKTTRGKKRRRSSSSTTPATGMAPTPTYPRQRDWNTRSGNVMEDRLHDPSGSVFSWWGGHPYRPLWEEVGGGGGGGAFRTPHPSGENGLEEGNGEKGGGRGGAAPALPPILQTYHCSRGGGGQPRVPRPPHQRHHRRRKHKHRARREKRHQHKRKSRKKHKKHHHHRKEKKEEETEEGEDEEKKEDEEEETRKKEKLERKRKKKEEKKAKKEQKRKKHHKNEDDTSSIDETKEEEQEGTNRKKKKKKKNHTEEAKEEKEGEEEWGEDYKKAVEKYGSRVNHPCFFDAYGNRRILTAVQVAANVARIKKKMLRQDRFGYYEEERAQVRLAKLKNPRPLSLLPSTGVPDPSDVPNIFDANTVKRAWTHPQMKNIFISKQGGGFVDSPLDYLLTRHGYWGQSAQVTVS